MISYRKVGTGWQGVLVDEGDVYWRCPHVHEGCIEAEDCALKEVRSHARAINRRDREINRAYEAGEIDVFEAVRRESAPMKRNDGHSAD